MGFRARKPVWEAELLHRFCVDQGQWWPGLEDHQGS